MRECEVNDMGGKCACCGAARAIAELSQTVVEVHVIRGRPRKHDPGRGPSTRRHPDGLQRQTIEVNNTDAEGRLTAGRCPRTPAGSS